jgi:hypothetical protein
MQSTCNRYCRILADLVSKLYTSQQNEGWLFLRKVKDCLGFKVPDVYCIQCEHVTGHAISTWYNEHEEHTTIKTSKVAITKHQDFIALARTTDYKGSLLEATNI